MRKIIWLSLFYALYFLWHVACGMWHDVICPGGRERYFPDFVFPFHHLLPPASSYSSIIHLSLSPHQKMPCKNSGPDVTPEPNNVTLLNQPEIHKTNIKSFTIPFFSGFRVSWNVQETSQATVAPWEPLHLPPQRLMSMWLISWQATNLPYLYPYQWK